MRMSLSSCLGHLKVMCGLSVEPTDFKSLNAATSGPISAGKFHTIWKQRKKHLALEFKALSTQQEEHTSHAALRNVLLNAKQEVVPYDHSRVIVWDRPVTLTTDYYNASFIDGYNGPREYIACQGPSVKSQVSFWHLIWQEGVTCIVMATGLFEHAVPQCDKYWPETTRPHAQHGSVHVWLERSTHLAQLNIRTFRVHREGSAESRLVTHYEMVGLHEDCPDPGLILEVRRRVTALPLAQTGPVLVHCRCGGGRTAVYMAVDICLHQLTVEDRVDVFSTVLHLRRFRKNMVRTTSQYAQIYNAVAMYLQCGLTVHPAASLPATVQLHYTHHGDIKHSKLDKEFQTLQCIVPRLSIGDCASGHRVENRSKSRDIMMLPPECARPYLTTADCGDSGTDFINAVYVDGYHSEQSYLVTQWPMKKTQADVWRLMLDFKVTSLVMMHDLHKFSRTYPRFWPQEVNQELTLGPIRVRYLSYERHPHMTVRTFAIRKMMNHLTGCETRQDEWVVKMFTVQGHGHRGGGGDSMVGSLCATMRGASDQDAHPRASPRGVGGAGVGLVSRSMLAVMEGVADWQKKSGNRTPVCVMSKDGSSRVGVYCAVSVCCDQVKAEGEVDVFTAVRHARKYRPQLIISLEEYRYVYQFMAEYVVLSSTNKPDIVVWESNPQAPSLPLPPASQRGVYVISSPPTNHESAFTPQPTPQMTKKESDFLSVRHTGRYYIRSPSELRPSNSMNNVTLTSNGPGSLTPLHNLGSGSAATLAKSNSFYSCLSDLSDVTSDLGDDISIPPNNNLLLPTSNGPWSNLNISCDHISPIPSPIHTPDMSLITAHRNSRDHNDIKVIHASYASLDDSLSGSIDTPRSSPATMKRLLHNHSNHSNGGTSNAKHAEGEQHSNYNMVKASGSPGFNWKLKISTSRFRKLVKHNSET